MSKIKFYKDSAKTQQVYPELDPEDITKFESLEDIENAFPNVSGEDTNLTLNHTVEAPMRLELAPSELEQETTTGKNLCNLNVVQDSRVVYNPDGTITINGEGGFSLKYSDYAFKANTTYYMKWELVSGSVNQENIFMNPNNTFFPKKDTFSPFKFDSDTVVSGFWIHGGALFTNAIIRIWFSETQSPFEPYTGGFPQPNPDFPSQVHSVSGDNEITVCGKNLFDINSLNFENVWIRPTGEKVAANNNGFLSYVEILPNAEYILSLNRSVASIGICEYDKNKNFIQRIVVSNSSSKTIITSTTTKYIGVFINIDGTTLVTKDIIDECEPQLEKSNQATTYEPYQGHSYEIDLGRANLLNANLTTQEINGVQVTRNNDGSYTLNGTTNANTNFTWFSGSLTLQKGKYYIGLVTKTDDMNLYLTNGGNTIIHQPMNVAYDTIELDSEKTYTSLRSYVVSGKTFNNVIFYPMISTEPFNKYSPYGTTPLEYCKIGTYSDEFFKNDPSDPNYDSSLELDRWYLKKNVGKVVLDGSESGWVYDSEFKYFRCPNYNFGDKIPGSQKIKQLSNYFIVTNDWGTTFRDNVNTNIMFAILNSGYRICIRNINYSNVEDFKNWLSTHNTEVYYALATPQYILLNDTLQHQLDDIYNWVESYPGQTNISQINNDLPFIISARAMKDLSVIDKYPTENSEHLVESGGVYEVVNDINERIADIDTIRHNSKNVVYGSETGANIYLDDAYDTNLAELSVDGVCKQETTTGKNLLDYVSNIKSSTNGLTNTLNADGSITTTGKITSNFTQIVTRTVITDILEDGQTYTLSQKDANKKLYLQVDAAKDDGTVSRITSRKEKFSFTVDKSTYIKYSFIIQTASMTDWGDSPLTITNKYMLCKGTDTADTSFEPYTGGQPSPSPDYPQEIKTITGNIKVTSCGKNLFGTEWEKYARNNTNGTSTVYSDNYIRTKNHILVKPNNIYSFKVETEKVINGGDIHYYDINKNFIGRDLIGTILTKTIPNNCHYINIQLYCNNGIIPSDINTTQLEESPTATPYEPYQGSSLNITIPSNEFIGKIDDTYKDTLKVEYNEEDGQYHLVLNKNIGKVVLNGSENWNLFFSTNGIFINSTLITSIKSSDTINCLSDYYVNTYSRAYIRNHLDSVNNVCATNGGEIIIANKSITSIDDFKTWLSIHNTEVYYALAEPYEVDLGIVDMPITYKNISHITNSEDANMSITYVKDINIVINKLTNAVVSLGSNV